MAFIEGGLLEVKMSLPEFLAYGLYIYIMKHLVRATTYIVHHRVLITNVFNAWKL